MPIMGPRTHGAWLASTVFDGARAFEGVAPDLDRHCERVNQSADQFQAQARRRYRNLAGAGARGHRALRRQCGTLHPADVLGRRPAAAAACCSIPKPRTGACASMTRRCRRPTGSAITLSPFRRPTMESAPVDCQGRLSLSQQFARADRGAGAGLQQLPDARHARQCRRIRQLRTSSWRRMAWSTRRRRTARS